MICKVIQPFAPNLAGAQTTFLTAEDMVAWHETRTERSWIRGEGTAYRSIEYIKFRLIDLGYELVED